MSANQTGNTKEGRAQMLGGEFDGSVLSLEEALRKVGVSPRQVWDRFRTDARFSERTAKFLLRGGLDLPADLRAVRLLMGQNFFGPEEWLSFYDETVSSRLLRRTKFPWGEDVLDGPCSFNPGKNVRETHVAFLGLSLLGGKPLTILRWHELHPKSTGQQPFFYFDQNPWYAGEGYAKDMTLEARWHLVLREVVPGSVGVGHEEQVKLLPAEYEVSAMVTEVSKNILSFRRTGVRPNQTIWVRCQERTSNGLLSLAGGWDGDGLGVDDWHGRAYGGVGMGASRKLPPKAA